MFWPLLKILAVSLAVARQVQKLIFSEKIINQVEWWVWDGGVKWMGTCPGVP